jgi:uncharacterized protein
MRRPLTILSTVLVALAVGAAGCGGDSGGSSPSGGGGSTEGIPAEYRNLALVGSSQGGSGYNYMVAASQIFNKHLGMNTTVQAGGTQENALLISSGQLKFGITSPGDLIAAAKDPNAVKETELRTVFNIFNVGFLIVVPKDSPAKSLRDLKGKRIAIGTPGGGEYPAFQQALTCLGMSQSDFQAQAIGKDEASAAYQDGNIDAWWAQGPNPTSSFTEVIESRRGGKVIGLGQELLDCFLKSDEFSEGEIPAKTYPGQTEAIPTVDEWFYAVATEELPENVAYQMAKALDEHHDELVATFPGAATSTAQNTADHVGFPLHPGTERYLKEKGLTPKTS